MKSKILDGTMLLDAQQSEETILAKGEAPQSQSKTTEERIEEEALPESLEGLSDEAKEQAYSTLQRILCNPTGGYALHERFRALFALKNIADDEAVKIVAKAFADKSDLLRHELAYVMGQMQNRTAVPYLSAILKDKEEYSPIVRHEAAEALGAIGDDAVLPLLRHHLKEDESVVVRETCELAVRLLECPPSERERPTEGFTSVDPAPPMHMVEASHASEEEKADALGAILMNAKLPLFERYQAMFALRNMNSEPAVLALARGFEDASALFRHEIAYVFGQLQHPASVPSLIATLSKTEEEGMVRHECAEALGSIATPEVLPVLEHFTHDPEDVVAQSCVVALDMYAYENSGHLDYVDTSLIAER